MDNRYFSSSIHQQTHQQQKGTWVRSKNKPWMKQNGTRNRCEQIVIPNPFFSGWPLYSEWSSDRWFIMSTKCEKFHPRVIYWKKMNINVYNRMIFLFFPFQLIILWRLKPASYVSIRQITIKWYRRNLMLGYEWFNWRGKRSEVTWPVWLSVIRLTVKYSNKTS